MSLMDKCGLYAGTPDRILLARPRELWDLKTGPYQDWHRYQGAAYINCLDDPFSYSRFGIYLKKNGSFPAVREFPKKEYVDDLRVFLAALTVYNAKSRTGSKHEHSAAE